MQAQAFLESAWCVGDLFLDSTDTQVLFIWLFGWVTKFVSLTATAWIGRVFTWAALAWAWQRLSWRVVPTRFIAVLSAALFVGLNHYFQMAGEWVVGGVEAKCFAYALVMWRLVRSSSGDGMLVGRRWARRRRFIRSWVGGVPWCAGFGYSKQAGRGRLRYRCCRRWSAARCWARLVLCQR